MTDQFNIQISAFVDNELLDQECALLVRRLCADTKLRDTVSRYALIGDILRGDNFAVREQLIQRISAAIDGNQELSPPAAVASSPGAGFDWQRYLKPVGGFAVAATVAMVAVLSLQSFNGPTDQALPSTTVAIWDTPDGSSDLRPVDLPRFTLPEVRPASGMPQSRMDQYLMRHKSYASGLGNQTIMGFRDLGSYTLVPVRITNDNAAPQNPDDTIQDNAQ